MFLYIPEPKNTPIGFIVVFGSIIFISMVVVYCLFAKRGKALKRREPRPWDGLHVSHKAGEIEEWETELGGDMAQIEEIQSN